MNVESAQEAKTAQNAQFTPKGSPVGKIKSAEKTKLPDEIISLSQLNPGSRCVVRRVDASSAMLKHKLLTMGIVEGTVLEVTLIAPLGDPMTIRALGYALSLRKAEAAGVMVTRL